MYNACSGGPTALEDDIMEEPDNVGVPSEKLKEI